MFNQSLTEWGVDIGCLLGVRIRIHWIFVIFALIFLLRETDKSFGLLYLVVLFTTVLIHEFGHIFAARHFGLDADKIVLWPLGGLAFVGRSRNAREEFWISFAGPLTQLILGLCSGLWLYLHGASIVAGNDILMPLLAVGVPTQGLGILVSIIFTVQIWLLALNMLLPAFPLDGGRMLVALVVNRVGTLRASGMAMILTLAVAIFLLARSDSLLGFFLLMEAGLLYQLRQTGQIYMHPAFQYNSLPITSGRLSAGKRSEATRSRAKQASHLRLVESKLCPKCGRSLSPSAKMCGVCEISI